MTSINKIYCWPLWVCNFRRISLIIKYIAWRNINIVDLMIARSNSKMGKKEKHRKGKGIGRESLLLMLQLQPTIPPLPPSLILIFKISINQYSFFISDPSIDFVSFWGLCPLSPTLKIHRFFSHLFFFPCHADGWWPKFSALFQTVSDEFVTEKWIEFSFYFSGRINIICRCFCQIFWLIFSLIMLLINLVLGFANPTVPFLLFLLFDNR